MKTPQVLETTLPVVEAARDVRVNRDRLEALCDVWSQHPFVVPGWDDVVHWSDGGEATLNYLLLLDALNFCFWVEPGATRWRIQYRGEWLDGYRALAASLKRAIENGTPLTDATYLRNLTVESLAQICAGEGQLPMLAERVRNAREVGEVLLRDYGGQFARAVEQADSSAVALVDTLSAKFSSFHDVARYDGREVRLLKRAQITVIDVVGSFAAERWGRFHDADQLTAFADYKIPQVLRAQGIMQYSLALAERVDQRVQLAAASPEEVEIRAAMIWAVEWIRQGLAKRGRNLRAYEIDWFLWNVGQAPVPDERPYHRVRTVFY